MQGKGIVKFFLVVMTFVCLLQYLFVLPTNKVENAADEYAEAQAAVAEPENQRAARRAARTAYLDSMSSEKVFSIPLLKDYTYQELKGQQLALGLDLKGGMSVVLQVDLKEFIRALSNNYKDPTFENALKNAEAAQRNAQADYVSLFVDEYQKIANGKTLASIFARSGALPGEVNFDMSDGQVETILRTKADETVELTFGLLKQRIDKLGVTQPNVSLDASRDLIVVELPGIDNPERARQFLKAAANLEFWNVYRNSDAGMLQGFFDANELLRKTVGGEEVTQEILRIDTTYAMDADGNNTEEIASLDTIYDSNQLGQQGPLFDVFTINQGSYSPSVMGTALKNQRKVISGENGYLQQPDIKRFFPQDVVFRWSKDPIPLRNGDETNPIAENTYQLYAIKKLPNSDKAPLSGERVVAASSNPDPQTNEVAISLKMDQEGAQKWGRMTTQAAQDNNREIAIVLDNEVVSAPRVINPITSGDSQITGDFSIQEGEDLAAVLEIGKLPAELDIIQESLVGPSLGAKNIRSSIMSLVIGFALLLGFMIFYYAGGGIVSILALLLNLFFIFGALASYGTVLTLPGIAGILLTIGMAVDASVIIYERIREELRDGKSMLVSIQDGFSNSYSAIIDANVTTLLVAFVLNYFGLGPIKGFAVVLIIGVISSLFTAVLVGRLMIDYWTKTKGNTMNFSSGFSKNAFANLKVDWLGKRKMAYGISAAIILLGIGSMFVRGFDLGVDFKGGYSYNVTFEQPMTADQIRTTMTDVFGSQPTVKAVDTENTYNIVTDYLVDNTADDTDSLVLAKFHEGIVAVTGEQLAFKDFTDTESSGTHLISSSKVGATIADDIKTSAFYSAVIALLFIFLYIAVRFSKWQYSAGAVAALFHDVLVVLSIFSIFHGILPFGLEIDQNFIAAILTVIGYSINDTVVVFDRIREFLNMYVKKGKEEVINMAINSTVSRTVITSLTTLFVVGILFVFGGASIRGFAFALLIGILVGTYSSIFIATPVMSDLTGDLEPRVAKKTEKTGTFNRREVSERQEP
ncbi:MAG: protein translocase subunit SecDF [Saprospiraceae bacterium]